MTKKFFLYYIILHIINLLTSSYVLYNGIAQNFIYYEPDIFIVVIFSSLCFFSIFFIEKIFPQKQGVREIRSNFFPIFVIVFFIATLWALATGQLGLRYGHESYLAKYNLIGVVHQLSMSFAIYAVVFVAVTKAPIRNIWKLLFIIAFTLSIDGLAMAMLLAVLIYLMYPQVVRARYAWFFLLIIPLIYSVGQYQKSNGTAPVLLEFSWSSVENTLAWSATRFGVHPMSLNYHLAHADQEDVSRKFWEITESNLYNRLCRLQGDNCEIGNFHKTFAQYNYQILTGRPDQFGGASPGFLAGFFVAFGWILGIAAAALWFHFIISFVVSLRPSGASFGIIEIYALLFALRGTLADPTDLFLIFSGSTLDMAGLLGFFIIGTKGSSKS